ncbi:MAG TPA: pitrilysin family protein, partial [Longimicrobium sp.]
MTAPAAVLDRARPPAPGPLRPFHFPAVQRATLANGLQVLVAERHAFPLVTIDLVIPAGGLSETEDRAGLSSFTSGLLESGAGDHDAAAIAERVDELGLVLDSTNSWDITLVGFTGLRARADEAMQVTADLAMRPTFPDYEVQRIRDERLASLAQRRADPSGLADELVTKFIYPEGHPFSRRLYGPAETLATLARADAAAFHETHFRPGGACVCAGGDLTLDEVVSLAEKHFGGWSGTVPAPRAPETHNRLNETTILLADRPGAVQSEVRVGHVGVPRTTDDFFAITVLNAMLGGTFASRLNLNLRERLGYTYSVGSSFGMRRLPGTFHVGGAIQVEGTAHSVSEILRDMRTLQEELVPEDEIDNARSYLAGIFPLGMETTDGIAGKLSTIATYGLPDDYYQIYRDRLVAVTREEVREAAQR